MGSEDEPDKSPTEGVRIIGAQEAAEAAGRPDVVRRRGRSDKKFGDRPDAPESAEDLPKIRISTSESLPGSDDTLGQGVVTTPEIDERRTIGDDEDVIVVGGHDRPRAGHARIIEDEDPDDDGSSEDPDVYRRHDDGMVIEVSGTDEIDAADDEESLEQTPLFEDEPVATADTDWDIEDPLFDGDSDETEGDADGTFVLPHWTEPATGQVPKVVSGVEPEDGPRTGESPRWHSEGERVVMTDFTDLTEDGPRLGALGGSLEDFDDEDDFLTGEDDFSDGRGDFFDDDEMFDDDDDEVDFGPPRRRRPAPSYEDDDGSAGGDRDLGAAVGVGVGLVVLGLVCFSLGGFATTLLVAVIIVISAAEAITALNKRSFATPAILALPAVLGLLFGTYFSGLSAYPVVLGLTVLTTLLWYLWVSPGPRAALKIGGTLLVVMWVGFLGSFATLMLGLGRQMQDIDESMKSNPAIGVLIAAVIVTVSHDVGAYFTGRFIGRTPLSAASPNKTYEGLAGGVVAGIILPVIIVGVFGIAPIGDSIAKTIVFSALCAGAAPLGDLCQSAIKRDLKVKDMGALLPGHGGVLDRFDAMLFVLPTAYFVTLLLDVWTITPA